MPYLKLSGYQWTLPENTAVAMTNLIAIVLALGLARLPFFGRALYVWLSRIWPRRSDRNVHHEASEGISLEDSDEATAGEERVAIPAAHLSCSRSEHDETHSLSISQFTSIEDALARARNILFRERIEVGVTDRGFRKIARQVLQNFRDDSLRFWLAVIFALVLLGAFVGEQTLAILSANIITGSKVLSAHPGCGDWGFNWTAIGHDSYQGEKSKASRALNYAERCYGPSDGIENCDMLASRTIGYSLERNASCPFPGDVCKTGALRMDTGYQSFLTLGLNAPSPAYLRRTLSCAPLTDRLLRVRKGADNSTYVFEYTHGYPS
jgi:hypothetical protein